MNITPFTSGQLWDLFVEVKVDFLPSFFYAIDHDATISIGGLWKAYISSTSL